MKYCISLLIILIGCNPSPKTEWYQFQTIDSSWVSIQNEWIDTTQIEFLKPISLERALEMNYENLIHIKKLEKRINNSIKLEKVLFTTKDGVFSEMDQIIKRINPRIEHILEFEKTEKAIIYSYTDSCITIEYSKKIDNQIEAIKAKETPLEKETGLYRRCGTGSPIMKLEEEYLSLLKFPKTITEKQAKTYYDHWKIDSLLAL